LAAPSQAQVQED